MTQIRVVYLSFMEVVGWTAWVRESEVNKWLEDRKIPQDAWIWLDRKDRFDRYLGYEDK